MDLEKTGALIAQARKERNLTQREVADALHVTVQAVSKWERGLSFPDAALLEPLSEALGLTVSDLLSGKRGETPRDELLRDTLRLLLSRTGIKVRRWKGLFSAAAALLTVLLLGIGYIWTRDNTDLLPQRKTIVSGSKNGQLSELAARASGGIRPHFFDITLADDCTGCTLQLELWDENGLIHSYEMVEYRRLEKEGEQDHFGSNRRRTFAVANWYSMGQINIGVSGLGEYTVSGFSPKIPPYYMKGGSALTALEEQTTVEKNCGVVLLCYSLVPIIPNNLGDFDPVPYPSGQVGGFEAPMVGEGEAFLLLRLFCS